MNKLKLVFTLNLILIGFLCNFSALAQDWDTAGNNILGGEFMGADATSSIPVQFHHNANTAIS